MKHDKAIAVFNEIQARPYSLSPAPGIPSNNCYFKGIELIQKLATLGYAVRGRVGETYWDPNIVPREICDLLPRDILVTHFFTEVMIDGEWHIADPSIQPALAKYGFTIGSFGKGGKSCFPITKLYTQEESWAYQDQWFDPAYQEDFFGRGGPCWRALDQWFAEKAKETQSEN